MSSVCITIKMNVPDEIISISDKATHEWLRDYFYRLAGSNDGSEFLANLTLNDSTVDIVEERT